MYGDLLQPVTFQIIGLIFIWKWHTSCIIFAILSLITGGGHVAAITFTIENLH